MLQKLVENSWQIEEVILTTFVSYRRRLVPKTMATNAALFESSQTSHTNADAVVLMWADPTVQSNTENTHTLQSFANMYDGIYTFQTTDACENAIRQLPASNRIHLIVSGAFSRSLLPRIHELPQLSTVYIFCLEQQRYLIWAKPFTKVGNSFHVSYTLYALLRSNPSLLTRTGSSL